RRAEAEGEKCDNILRASTAHQWGFWYYRQGRLDEALDRLHAALDLSGCDHYVTAFLLDQFGLVYWRKNNFPAALDFFRLAAARLGRFKDEQSVVQPLAHRAHLQLDWDQPGAAEKGRSQRMRLSRQGGCPWGQAEEYSFRGQVAL